MEDVSGIINNATLVLEETPFLKKNAQDFLSVPSKDCFILYHYLKARILRFFSDSGTEESFYKIIKHNFMKAKSVNFSISYLQFKIMH